MANMETPQGQRPETKPISSKPPEWPNPVRPKSGLGKLLGIAFAIIVAVIGGLWFKQYSAKSTKSAAPTSGRGGGGLIGLVPVVAGTVTQKDVPIYLDGLGTVQAFKTVTIRPRV